MVHDYVGVDYNKVYLWRIYACKLENAEQTEETCCRPLHRPAFTSFDWNHEATAAWIGNNTACERSISLHAGQLPAKDIGFYRYVRALLDLPTRYIRARADPQTAEEE